MSKIPVYKKKNESKSKLTLSNSTKKFNSTKNIEGERDIKQQFALLEIRRKLIEHLLEENESIKRLLQEKKTNENLLLSMEFELMEKENVINILRKVMHGKKTLSEYFIPVTDGPYQTYLK